MEELPFTPLSIDPTSIVLMSWDELRDTFDYKEDKGTLIMADYSVKVFAGDDPQLANEVSVSNKLKTLTDTHQTLVFNYAYGYVLSTELPPHYTRLSNAIHYVYLFSQRINHQFCELPDEAKVNEDFYFEILIGIYYARKQFNFSHWDIHEGNLMFNLRDRPATRAYRIGSFYVTIENTRIEPKLIDYGKSVIDATYSDDRWKEPQFKKLWNKSDIHHLSWIFSERKQLSDRFRDFLTNDVLPKYASSRYATKLEEDSAANHANIEQLLQSYFGANQTVQCMVCTGVARYKDTTGVFCGEACQLKWYE